MTIEADLESMRFMMRAFKTMHGPFNHDYIKDEKCCDRCKLLKNNEDALERIVLEIKGLQHFNDVFRTALSQATSITSEALERTSIMSRSIDDLELTVRTGNVLRREGIKTIGELVEYKIPLKNLPGMGRRGVAEVQETLAQYGLALHT